MSRFLFVAPPFAAHVNPLVSIGEELTARGHQVAWVLHDVMKPLLPNGATLHAIASSLSEHALDDLRHATGAPSFAGLKVLFERVLAPLAEEMLPAVEAAIGRFGPDLLIVDQQAFAGVLAARRQGLRWATSSPSAALLQDGFARFPLVKEWLAALFAQLERKAGVEPVATPDLSPDLVILYASRLLAGFGRRFPAHFHFVGPALSRRPEQTPFPWERIGSHPLVLVSLGTLFTGQGHRFFRTLAEALRDSPLQVIVSARGDLLPAPPDNFIVQPWVPMSALLPRCNAVLCHAGTILNEALFHGIPAVVAPIAHEQSTYAELAVAAGAATRVAFRRVTATELRAAVLAILHEPAYRAASRRVGESFLAAGGAGAAAIAIERLQARPRIAVAARAGPTAAPTLVDARDPR